MGKNEALLVLGAILALSGAILLAPGNLDKDFEVVAGLILTAGIASAIVGTVFIFIRKK